MHVFDNRYLYAFGGSIVGYMGKTKSVQVERLDLCKDIYSENTFWEILPVHIKGIKLGLLKLNDNGLILFGGYKQNIIIFDLEKNQKVGIHAET